MVLIKNSRRNNMLVKIYWSIWALFLVASFVLFAAGAMTSFVIVTLGFIAFGLTFMGMMGVLPAMVSHPTPQKEAKVKRVVISYRFEKQLIQRGSAD